MLRRDWVCLDEENPSDMIEQLGKRSATPEKPIMREYELYCGKEVKYHI
jgi:hypothetical protein